MQNETILKTENILNGGTIELWRINGLFCVKAVVGGVAKWSECVSEFMKQIILFLMQLITVIWTFNFY